MKQEIKYKNILATVSGIASLMAIIPLWPYDYYLLLRVLVFGTAIFIAYVLRNLEDKKWFYMMIVIAILFNPLAPVHLTRLIWLPINIITSIIFFKSIKISH